ncbi:carbohydrate ABC transporter permease [Bauldia sp.]|uniref:carbohydrate ABC transporter permease n=1 Tax=Bauldia sp. TaxID=2575872 RepID=UPI003BA95F56
MSRQHRTYWTICLVLGVFALIWSVPTIWMVSLSLQPNELLARTTTNTVLGLIPIPFTWDNFVQLFNFGLTPRWFLNSAIVAIGMTVLVLILSTTAGYAFARIPFKGRRLVLAIVLAGLTVPEQVIFIPLYTMFADWGLHNTHVALITPRLAVPLGVFLMVQFFRGIPKELEEAAALDGANRFVIFARIVLPLSIPAVTTLAILTFLYAWNDYLWPLVSAQRQEMFTITVGLGSIQENFAATEGLGRLMASGVVASLPVVVLFVVFQRFVVRGIALGTSR